MRCQSDAFVYLLIFKNIYMSELPQCEPWKLQDVHYEGSTEKQSREPGHYRGSFGIQRKEGQKRNLMSTGNGKVFS